MVETANFENWGYREIEEAGDLLKMYASDKLTKDARDYFDNRGVTVNFNKNSGYVFLSNEDYQVLMDDGEGKLDLWHSLPYSGEEGFKEDLIEMYDELDEDDKEYLDSFK